MQRPHEIDKILLLQLRQIGCNVEQVQKIGDFSKEILYRCAVVLVSKIYEQQNKQPEDVPSELPPDMSSRFRVCSLLVDSIRDELGYPNKNDLSFDMFLYPNEQKSRKLLSWLMEQLMAEMTEEEAIKLRNLASKQNKDQTLSVEPLIQFAKERNKQTSTFDHLSTQSNDYFLVDDTDEYTGLSVAEKIQRTLNNLVKSQWVTTPSKRMNIKPNTSHIKTYRVYFVDETNSNEQEERYSKKFSPLIMDQVKHSAEHLAESIFQDNLKKILQENWREQELLSQNQDQNEAKLYFIQKKNRVLRMVAENLKIASQRGGFGSDGQNVNSDTSNESIDKLLSKLSTDQYYTSGENSNFSKRVQFETEQTQQKTKQEELNPEQEEERRNQELEQLQTMLEKVSTAVEVLKSNIESMNSSITQTEDAIQVENNQKKELEEQFRLKKKTVIMLQDKDNNIREMEQINNANAQKLLDLAQEWETHRQPLLEKYRNMKNAIINRKASYRTLLESVKQQRENMKKYISEIRQKEELHKTLLQEYEQLPKDVNRSDYIVRIMDVVRNIEKQKQEIAKVLLETKDLRRELTTLEEKLQRTFKETEDLIFNDAQNPKNPSADFSKQVYKSVVEMKKLFEQTIQCVEETGKALNSIRTLEQQIEQIQQRNDALNVERLEKDLETVRSENQQMLAQLKK